jgi:hypothetical protein
VTPAPRPRAVHRSPQVSPHLCPLVHPFVTRSPPPRRECSGTPSGLAAAARTPTSREELAVVHTCGQLCGYVGRAHDHPPNGQPFPQRLWTTGGQPVHGGGNHWGRRRSRCGRPVGDVPASTPHAGSSAGRSTRHTHPDRAADLHRRRSSTVPTGPTTMTRSLNSAIPPRVPTRPPPREPRTTMTGTDDHGAGRSSPPSRTLRCAPPDSPIRVGRAARGH